MCRDHLLLDDAVVVHSREPDAAVQGVEGISIVAWFAALVWFTRRKEPRSVKGVLLAAGTLLALMLLLVAACFGIVGIYRTPG